MSAEAFFFHGQQDKPYILSVAELQPRLRGAQKLCPFLHCFHDKCTPYAFPFWVRGKEEVTHQISASMKGSLDPPADI